MKQKWKRFARFHQSLTRLALVLIAVGAGYLFRAWQDGGGSAPSMAPVSARQAATAPAPGDKPAAVWTCSMHPQIRQPKPGRCPLCAMDLIPVQKESDASSAPRTLRLSPAARALAEVAVAPVERRRVTRDVRMVGKIAYDETRVETITAWVPGRLDRLFVDYTGVPVRQGDHMVYLYSPEILTAQQELLQAVKAAADLGNSNLPVVRDTAEATAAAAREKLRLWGLTAAQVAEIEKRGKPSDHITIYAPAGGIVVHKNAVEGMYVQTGTQIYTIADLEQVWVKLDAYEADLAWLRYAQRVEFTTEAYPGETFSGRISFIAPVLDEATRTVKVRVNVANAAGRLKPGMFVRAVVHAALGGGGRVIDPDLAGKWISPMHPEIVKDAPGACDACGMPLVRAETLGYAATAGTDGPAPLVIPASAVLVTGQRAVVYVQSPADPGVFTGRVVELGPRADNYYIVTTGLEEGTLVVVNGNFKIDSALQILAEPSMMNPAPDSGAGAPATAPAADAAAARSDDVPLTFAQPFERVVAAYQVIQRELAADRYDAAHAAQNGLLDALAAVDAAALDDTARRAWIALARDLEAAARAGLAAASIEASRAAFALLSEALTGAVQRFGAGLTRPLYHVQCPMAFDNRGASWLQDNELISNPYFGATMLRCGEVRGRLTPHGHARGKEDEAHD